MISIIMEYATDDGKRETYKFIRYAGLDTRMALAKKKKEADKEHVESLKKYIQAMTQQQTPDNPIQKFIPEGSLPTGSIWDKLKDALRTKKDEEDEKDQVQAAKKRQTRYLSTPERAKSRSIRRGESAPRTGGLFDPGTDNSGVHSQATIMFPSGSRLT